MMNRMGDERTDLKGMTLGELEAFFRSRGKERYRARQVSRWIYQRGAEEFSVMTDLSRGFRMEMEAGCRISSPPADKEEVSLDGTEKVLFRLEDGEGIESVLIPEGNRRTLCVSTQAGCALSCMFCATGSSGFRRNLTSAEIIHQASFAARRMAERGDRLTNVVFMGMGEPLANERPVFSAIDRLTDPDAFGLGSRHVTVSTVGMVRGIGRLAQAHPQVGLAVSVHAGSDELRDQLVPPNRWYPLADLEAAIAGWHAVTKRRPTIEWAMIDHVNDTDEQAELLAAFAGRLRAHVNLIQLNPTPGYPVVGSSSSRIRRFVGTLERRGVNVTVRDTRGRDIEAACGQLRWEFERAGPVGAGPRHATPASSAGSTAS